MSHSPALATRHPGALFKFIVIIFVLLTASHPDARAQDQGSALVINEIMASAGPDARAKSGNGLMDEDGDYPDWIELKNIGDSPVDASGYYLTDDPS